MGDPYSFGAWVRRRRRQLDLTQAALAARIGVAAVTVQKLEADERRPSRQVAILLADVLQVTEPEREAFLAAARGERTVDQIPELPSGAPGPAGGSARLPSTPTSFIGRAHELAELDALLARHDARLITLTGAGGSGKTRLAAELAARSAANYPDGVRFVDLSTVRDADRVGDAIVHALGIGDVAGVAPEDRLIRWLQGRSVLLLLDNLEQVVESQRLIAAILRSAPHTQILATSRVPLRITAEHEYPLRPLPAPADDVASEPEARTLRISEIARYEAVQLFCERAAAIRPGFTLSTENAAAVAGVCAMLEGLPLAIELAVAQLRLLSPAQLLDSLRSYGQLALLSNGMRDVPHRQRTIRSTIAWSYAILDPTEQRTLTTLGVFSGGFTVDAVLAICATSAADAFRCLTSLVEHGLVRADEAAAAPRYFLLAPVLEFVRELLSADAAEAEAHARHAAYFLSFCETARPHLYGPEAVTWLDHLDRELDNLRAAAEHARRAGDASFLARLALALTEFWHARGHFDGSRWLEYALSHADRLPELVRADAVVLALYIPSSAGSDYLLEASRVLLGESRAIYERLGDAARIATIRHHEGRLAYFAADLELATSLLSDGLLQARACGDAAEEGDIFFFLGLTQLSADDEAGAERYLRDGLAVMQTSGWQRGIAHLLLGLGELAYRRRDFDQAWAITAERLETERAIRNRAGMANCIHWLGMVAMARGELRRAAALFQESRTIWDEMGYEPGLAEDLQLAYIAALEGAPDALEQLRATLATARHTNDDRAAICAAEGYAYLAAAQGVPSLAVQVIGATSAWRPGVLHSGWTAWPDEGWRREELLARCRADLGDYAYEEAWRAGEALGWEAVVAEVQRSLAVRAGAADG